MADPSKPEPEITPDPEQEAKRKAAREMLRKVVLGTLATTGGLSILGWHAQAHGNRSSHLTAEVRWAADRYVFERENYLNPGAPGVEQLRDVLQELDGLDARQRAFAAGNAPTGLTLAEHGKASQLRAQRALLESSLTYRPLTTQVVSLLGAGKPSQAVATIESSGSAADVLQGYIFTQLDLYNASFVDGRSTSAYTKELEAISEAAITYADKLPKTPENQQALAAILHNYATAMAPDVGTPAAPSAAKGRAAAARALQIREGLGDPAPIARAKWMMALQDYRAGDFKAATTRFAEAETALGALVSDPKQAQGLAEAANALRTDQAEARVYAALAGIRAGQPVKAQLVNINAGVEGLSGADPIRRETLLAEVRQVTGRTLRLN